MAARKRSRKPAADGQGSRPRSKGPDGTPAAPPLQATDRQPPPGPPVVGIGASAGGLDAFKRFFTAMRADSGIAFVLVPHLDPSHKSLMAELLARHTTMPVVEATDQLAVEADHVYIIPPDKYMTIHAGILRLTGPVERGTSQTTIDHFLRSLADDRQERAICIILSGTVGHGTLGLKAVKAAGGMAMVQDPATADFAQMPQTAIATGLADFVLPVEQMPEALLRYVQNPYVHGGRPDEPAPSSADALSEVLSLLRARARFDFRPYRKKMLARRIERRMGLQHIDSMARYVEFLRDNADEVNHLVKDLFISVTSFFRDPEAFEELARQVIAPLVQRKQSGSVIRLWVPGCATGEEAYSLVILLLEELAAARKSCQLQVFATDVDQAALEVGRQGLYPDSSAADVTPQRLARYFTRVDHAFYRVNKQVRESIAFAVQNVISDAPFSKMDLIACRNLLIYLEPEVQQKVIALLHFALNEGGFLFLGASETIGRDVDLFEPVSKKWRIFRRIGPSRPDRVEFPLVTGLEQARQGRAAGPGMEGPFNYAELTQRLVLEEFSPAAVLINRNFRILYFLGPTGRYLELPAGEPVLDLITMAREGLRSSLRAGLHQALRDKVPVVLGDAQVKRNGSFQPVAVTVRQVLAPRLGEELFLVVFQDRPAALPAPPPTAADEALMQQLDNELRATRADLQSTIEEAQSSNEELNASNEEVMSMNEELQSANEELGSSKEELQSLNEELATLNNQLQDKVHELEAANDDLDNLLNCTDVATVFLNRAFRIKRFTPASRRLFCFLASDLGRPLSDITTRFSDPDLLDDAAAVLQQLAPREKEVATADGTWWSRRITPYLTSDERVEGVIITFSDVTQVKRADVQERLLATVVRSTSDAVIIHDFAGNITAWNQGAEHLYGYSAAEAAQIKVDQLVPDELRPELHAVWDRLRQREKVDSWQTRRVAKGGRLLDIWASPVVVVDAAGQPVAIAKMDRDITQMNQVRLHLEQQIQRGIQAVREREERLQAILNTAADAIITIDHAGIIQSVNRAGEAMFGYAAQEMLGQNVKVLMPAPYRAEHDDYLRRYLQTREKRIIGIGREVEARRKDGTVFAVDLAVSEVEHAGLFTGMIRDITARKNLEREVLEVASLEQQRIAQELHDTAAQELTALGLLADRVETVLRKNAPADLNIGSKLSEGIHRVLVQVRAVSHGLMRVEVEAQGLAAALSELAAEMSETYQVACAFAAKTPVRMADNQAATQLYCIAREAVTNACKHGRPRNIGIELEADARSVQLRVHDDGVGLPEPPPLNVRGMGLRIMRYRAGLIDGHLVIDAAQPSGTTVTCKSSRGHHAKD